jgi:t-SNARE complex subunit (syntaxin)
LERLCGGVGEGERSDRKRAWTICIVRTADIVVVVVVVVGGELT